MLSAGVRVNRDSGSPACRRGPGMGGAGLGPAQAAAAGAGAADNSESLTKFGGTSPGGISESNRLPGIIRMILIYVGFEMRYFRAQVHRSNTICNRDSDH